MSVTTRSAGVLLHPTSLPGPFGVGDLGPAAHRWVELLARAGLAWWQVLPVGPTGYADSPYQSPSTFAGNLNLLSPEALAADGLASAADVCACELPADGPVVFADVIPRKRQLVRAAWERFEAGDGRPALHAAFDAFTAAEADWLDDYAVFAAIKDAHGGAPWWEWRSNDYTADGVAVHRFGQFLFARQWSALRRHAAGLGVKLIGDLPIYVAHDSADVWANPQLFRLDATHTPTHVAGVPPDYFAATGQLWGNPLYAWDRHRADGFAWWAKRVRGILKHVDLIRLDHFRGLEAYWAVPFGDPTAEHGTWQLAPGQELLAALKAQLGTLPIIAEDLGFITPEVHALRTGFGLPGMRILQFAFGGAVEPRFRPHRFTPDAVAYTGTHDNDTTAGWYARLTSAERADFARYAAGAEDPVRALLRLAWASVAELAVCPLQDLLGLGSEARMNTPGTTIGNWTWRAPAAALAAPDWLDFLREVTATYERSTRPAA
ncbi:4-alpha-glucanotransferase [Urbifossiella limnaea]|uniref:4-alpha-glucanotransferase n=1 Tax=Urbifossiella limnaea TaxID=2528023 RepID=A0A517XPE4_9BACT|nr:4-alpha-glucanotransferase [Urbifossiella limnaea]QDU19375.1 4-alpha-glucanotransferase [Urbifossiella limnaea]